AARERDEARRAQAEARHEVKLAATDQLTGAWTRRFGLVQITREIERARRTGGTLTLAFVDVDDLKKVNDSHGHAVGDRLLYLAVEAMRATLRPYDVVVRYGGDEFLCAMPNITRGAATERMTAIAATLSAAETGHSISFGLAEHQPDDGLQELVGRADADLLAARRWREQST
ncbi:MAG: GGDEF domain-containing protein, partial [Actinomycetota bacterium]|nr:GGDEF domain-containing protein [Actinomycetota bacterium]